MNDAICSIKTDEFSLSFNGYLKILSIQGKCIEEAFIQNSSSYNIDIQGFEVGLYVFNIVNKSSISSFKVIKK